LGTNSGNIARAGNTATVNVVVDSGAANVSGTVSKLESGTTTVIPNIYGIYYANGTAAAVTQTGADGSYALQNVPAGGYQIYAALNERDKATISGTAAVGANVTGQNLTIQVLNTYGTVSGVVRLPNGTPVSGAVVYVGSTGVLSAADGTFTLPGIPIQNSPQTIS